MDPVPCEIIFVQKTEHAKILLSLCRGCMSTLGMYWARNCTPHLLSSWHTLANSSGGWWVLKRRRVDHVWNTPKKDWESVHQRANVFAPSLYLRQDRLCLEIVCFEKLQRESHHHQDRKVYAGGWDGFTCDYLLSYAEMRCYSLPNKSLYPRICLWICWRLLRSVPS